MTDRQNVACFCKLKMHQNLFFVGVKERLKLADALFYAFYAP